MDSQLTTYQSGNYSHVYSLGGWGLNRHHAERTEQMTAELAMVFLIVTIGLSLVVAFIFWQQHRDLAPLRKSREPEKK
jgi:hypothetical protein